MSILITNVQYMSKNRFRLRPRGPVMSVPHLSLAIAASSWKLAPLQRTNLRGAASSGTTTSLTDNSASWQTDSLLGCLIEFTGGANAGLRRLITGNSDKTITWLDPFPHAVLTGDSYIILDQYRLTNIDTQIAYTFAGHNANWPDDEKGVLLSRSTVSGLHSITYGYDSGMRRVTTVTTDQGLSVIYTWGTSGSLVGKLLKAEVTSGSNQVLQRAVYTYYTAGTHSEDCGSEGDLIQVETWTCVPGQYLSTTPQASEIANHRVTQYRYYRSGASDGDASQLKMVLESDAVQSVIADSGGSNSPAWILTQADNAVITGSATLAQYASRAFTYYVSDANTASITTPWGGVAEALESKYGGSSLDETGYVKTETIRGTCGGCGGGAGRAETKTYYYLQLNTGSGNAQAVTNITVEDTQDASGNAAYRKVHGLNFKGIELRRAMIVGDPSSPQYWCRSVIVGLGTGTDGAELDLGQPLEIRLPSAHTCVDNASQLRNFLNPPAAAMTTTHSMRHPA